MIRPSRNALPAVSSRPMPVLYVVLLSIAAFWAIGNCAYVYLVLAGARTYRIESAVLIFVAVLVPALLMPGRVDRRPELPAPALWGIAVAALAGWLAIMTPLVTYPFLSDDYVFLGRYQTWSDLLNVQELFRPFFAFVFWRVSSIGGGSTVPFHILGWMLHVACAVLVGLLMRRILSSRTAGVVAFALFLVNALQLEATLWVSGLQELLCGFFALSAAVIYTRGPDATLQRALAATPCIGLALLSKETAIGYLFLLPLLDLSLGRMKRVSNAIGNYVLFGGIVVAYLMVRSRFTRPDPDFLVEPSRYFLKQFLTLPYKFFVQPWNAEAVDMPQAVSFALCAVTLVVLLLGAIRRRLSSLNLTGPLIVISFTLPLYTYFFVGPDLMAARYLYLPFVGWVLLSSDVLTALVRRPAVLMAVVAILVTLNLAALQLNLRPWRTAAAAIGVMESAIEQGADPLVAVRAWEDEHLIHMTRRGNVPVDYRGVYVFRNGYDEFVRFTAGRSAGRR